VLTGHGVAVTPAYHPRWAETPDASVAATATIAGPPAESAPVVIEADKVTSCIANCSGRIVPVGPNSLRRAMSTAMSTSCTQD
jgi:hypothetical protein